MKWYISPASGPLYPPHQHVEPELYYYKFLPENGYGLAEYGDDAFKVKNNDLTGMPENVTHSQVPLRPAMRSITCGASVCRTTRTS